MSNNKKLSIKNGNILQYTEMTTRWQQNVQQAQKINVLEKKICRYFFPLLIVIKLIFHIEGDFDIAAESFPV